MLKLEKKASNLAKTDIKNRSDNDDNDVDDDKLEVVRRIPQHPCSRIATQERLYNDIPKIVLSDADEFYIHHKTGSLLISFKRDPEQ